MGRLAVGNPIKGVPAGRSPAPTSYQTKPHRKRSDKRFDSLARLFALDSVVVCHAAISLKLRPRGHPRAACGPPFPIFGLRPRRSGVGFRFLRKARKGLCPFHPHQPFEKGWTENLGFLRCGRHFAGCLNPSLRSLARGSSAAAT